MITNYKSFLEYKTQNVESTIILNGHEVPEFWYHGTNKYFKRFDLKYMASNFEQSILGIYFSQYIEPGIYGSTAKEYAEDLVVRQGGKPYVYKCKINLKNPLILDSSGWYSTNTYIDKNRNDLKRYIERNNYDGLISYNFDSKKTDGLAWADLILVTNKISNIEIIKIIEL